MGTKDPRVDAYIEDAAEFAQPVLTHLRKVVHKAYPKVEETIRWGSPYFAVNGKLLCFMAAFTRHVAFGFWNTGQVEDPDGILQPLRRITSRDGLPSDKVLTQYIRNAAAIAEKGVKRTVAAKPPPKVPPALAQALAKNKKARAAFDAFPPSHKREYVEWIAEAKTEETRARRVATAVEWMAEGKSRNWKYDKRTR